MAQFSTGTESPAHQEQEWLRRDAATQQDPNRQVEVKIVPETRWLPMRYASRAEYTRLGIGIVTTRELSVAQSEDRVTVALPTRSPYMPIPLFLTGTELFGIVLVPLWLIGAAIMRSLLRIKPPPRALFDISESRFCMALVSQEHGEKSYFECNRADIVGLRKNEFEKGLWMHVQGKSMDTYLQDIEDETIVALVATLREILT